MAFGKKRGASSAAGGAKKRPASNSAMCNVVAAELAKATGLSKTCGSMLSKMVKDSLTVFAAERHQYQAKAVAMAGETLAGVQAELENGIAQAQATVDSAEKEKASRIELESSAKQTLANLQDSMTNAKKAVDEDAAAEKAAKATASSIKDAIVKKDAELAALEDMKSRLTISKDSYEPLKVSESKAAKRTVSAITKCLADAGLEDGLVDSLGTTLPKSSTAHSTYDGIVFKEVDAFIVSKFAELEASIGSWQPGKDSLLNEEQAAETAHAASIEKLKASQAALAEAEGAMKEGKKAHAKAAASVGSYASDMGKAAKALEKANAALVAFQEGPKKCYEALKDLAPPPPEPEPEVIEETTVEAAVVA